MQRRLNIAGVDLGIVIQPLGIFGVVRGLDLLLLEMIPARVFACHQLRAGVAAALAPVSVRLGIGVSVLAPDGQAVIGIPVHIRIVLLCEIAALQVSSGSIFKQDLSEQEVR